MSEAPLKILLASSSAHKVAEISRMVETSGLKVDIVGLADVDPYPEPVENGRNFEDNALIKARAGYSVRGLPTLADDSGIEVDVLNRMPGVRSARWAAVGATDEENLDLLIRQIADVEPARRTARFVCAMALVGEGFERGVRGTVEGVLAPDKRGSNGFGYDPIFLPEGGSRTTAELSSEEKDAISHRGRALRAMVAHIEDLVSRVAPPPCSPLQNEPHSSLVPRETLVEVRIPNQERA